MLSSRVGSVYKGSGVLNLSWAHSNQAKRECYKAIWSYWVQNWLMWFLNQPLSPVGNIKRPWRGNLGKFWPFFGRSREWTCLLCWWQEWLAFNPRKCSQLHYWAKNIPAVGFSTAPKIVFYHEAPVGRKMTVNTCAIVMTFPVNNIYMEYESLKNEMITCIPDCQGFGMVLGSCKTFL